MSTDKNINNFFFQSEFRLDAVLNFAENAAQTLCQLLAWPVPIPKYETPVMEFVKYAKSPCLSRLWTPPLPTSPTKNFTALLQSSKLHPTLARNNCNFTNTTIVFTGTCTYVGTTKKPIRQQTFTKPTCVYAETADCRGSRRENPPNRNLSCRTGKMRSRVRTELIVFADFLSKQIFRAFPAYNPALSYNRIPVQIIQFFT